MRTPARRFLLTMALGVALSACRTPRKPAPPVVPARHDAATVVIRGRAFPADLVRRHREREEFAQRPPNAFWRSPALRIGIAAEPIAVVYAYQSEARRPFCMSSSTAASLWLLCLDAEARVTSTHSLALADAYRVVRPPAPYRFAIFVDTDALRSGVPRVGDVVTLPAEAWRGAEPEVAPITDPPPARIEVGGRPVTVEVAHTRDARALGLMYRDRLPDGRGMLFLYGAPKVLSFWMVNARIPLDLAYLDADGRILKTGSLRPLDLDGLGSGEPARMVLEVPAGWLRARGVGVGDRVVLPDRVRALRDKADP